MLIEAKNVSKTYGSGGSQVTALWEVTLTIKPGDFLSIMGPSGSGKSTLLHLLSGLDCPTAGRLLYDGQDIYGMSDRELSAFRRRRFGFIFQQFQLLPVLTAQENILMPLLLDGRKATGPKGGQKISSYLEQLTDLLGLGDRLTHLPHELSGGQQQRVAIARALIAEPDIIFADEPTGNLDSKNGKDVMRMLEEIHHRFGKTLVVITHDSRIAKRATRQLVIEDGRLSEG
ncbi:MAG: ABC transporter ATP-binding protein [Lachnospiraceae bacterium]|nr:ABC transporter ATP-binding protein [Lachnospiraceae bacterium]